MDPQGPMYTVAFNGKALKPPVLHRYGYANDLPEKLYLYCMRDNGTGVFWLTEKGVQGNGGGAFWIWV